MIPDTLQFTEWCAIPCEQMTQSPTWEVFALYALAVGFGAFLLGVGIGRGPARW
jgi:hypothetical protein